MKNDYFYFGAKVEAKPRFQTVTAERAGVIEFVPDDNAAEVHSN